MANGPIRDERVRFARDARLKFEHPAPPELAPAAAPDRRLFSALDSDSRPSRLLGVPSPTRQTASRLAHLAREIWVSAGAWRLSEGVSSGCHYVSSAPVTAQPSCQERIRRAPFAASLLRRRGGGRCAQICRRPRSAPLPPAASGRRSARPARDSGGARSRSCSPPSRTPRVVTPRLLKISFAKPRSTSGRCRRSSRSLTGRPGGPITVGVGRARGENLADLQIADSQPLALAQQLARPLHPRRERGGVGLRASSA
jgi:hypothetical protein